MRLRMESIGCCRARRSQEHGIGFTVQGSSQMMNSPGAEGIQPRRFTSITNATATAAATTASMKPRFQLLLQLLIDLIGFLLGLSRQHL
jgi:hypothetical protein